MSLSCYGTKTVCVDEACQEENKKKKNSWSGLTDHSWFDLPHVSRLPSCGVERLGGPARLGLNEWLRRTRTTMKLSAPIDAYFPVDSASSSRCLTKTFLHVHFWTSCGLGGGILVTLQKLNSNQDLIFQIKAKYCMPVLVCQHTSSYRAVCFVMSLA